MTTGKRGCPRALTPEQVEWAYRKVCEGHSQRQVARSLFVCHVTLHAALKNFFKIKSPSRAMQTIPLVYDGPDEAGQLKPGQKLTPLKIEWAYRKVCDGHSRRQVASALGVVPDTISRALKDRPVKVALLVYDGEEELKDEPD